MTTNVPVVNINDTIDFIENQLLADIKQLESINYLYVLNKKNILKGVISIKELFRQPKTKKVSLVMTKNPVTAHPYTHQEKVAYLALKNNIKSVPIVDHDNKFLGAVLSDDILNIIYNEQQEDISHLVGVQHHAVNLDNINTLSLYVSLKHRLPWLIVGMLGGLIAAQVINLFEETLSHNIILASFIPLVVYIASAVGTQAGFFVVRDLAINKKINFITYVFRQFMVILSMGFIISFLVFGSALFFYGDLKIALVLSSAIFITILSSIITGLFIPYAFNRFSLDPANASGPIATIIQDLISVSIYLLVAAIII